MSGEVCPWENGVVAGVGVEFEVFGFVQPAAVARDVFVQFQCLNLFSRSI